MALAEQVEYYTYADYLEWDTEERYELIDGVPYLMSPGPSPQHQSLSMTLSILIGNYLKDKPCKVFAAPFDVRLNADTADDTVVQPDILVVCDKSKIDKRGCKGAPDLVIEITSKSTGSYDRGLKLKKYVNAGVREYWIVDPENKIVQVYTAQSDNRSSLLFYDETDVAPINIFDDFKIDLAELFADL
jgi:Uma2 family endonuclease